VRRAALFTGITLGTCLTVLAYMDGARLAVPALPHLIGVTLGAVLVWLALAAAVTWLAELLRRHHKALAAHAARHGKRGAIAAARTAGRGGRSVTSRLTSWAGPRWAARRPVSGGMGWATPEATAERRARREAGRRDGPGQGRPCNHCGSPAGEICRTGCPTWNMRGVPGGGDIVAGSAKERLSDAQRERDANGQQNICAACGHQGTPGDPLVIAGGYRVHTSETTDPASGFHDPAGAPAPAVPAQNGETTMANSRINPDRRAHRAAASSGGKVPSEWGPVVGAAADFEPEDDAHLLGWMADQVAGMAAYAEGLIEAYETGVNTVGIDPKGLAALHDVADAAAHAAETMHGARGKFADHYELPREFAANGGVMTHDGRWITGEGG
jgi:hypothetical protein